VETVLSMQDEVLRYAMHCQNVLRGQALLLGDSADGLQGQRIGSDAWFQAEADRRQGLGGIVTARLLAGECAGSARFR
jgi:hypothetical protein